MVTSVCCPQALVYDPTGKDIKMGDYMCFDDQVSNIVLEHFGNHGPNPSKSQLDRLSSDCRDAYECERPNYKDSDAMIGF